MCIPGYWLGAFHRFAAPRRLVYPLGWGTLGYAFPAGLGAALAVLREAISNVARHALADGAEVDVTVGADLLELRVADDGVGLPPGVIESGLRNVRRRADDLGGSLELAPVGARGTVLLWRVPLA